MKKGSRKIFLSLMSLLFAVVVASTSTYAYFQINKEAWLGNLGLTVSSGDGIMISVDGSNYTESLSEETLYKAVVSKFKGWTFGTDGELYDNATKKTEDEVKEAFKEIYLVPVTSFDGTTFVDSAQSSTDVSTGAYVSFDIYFTAETKPDDGKIIPINFGKGYSVSTANEVIAPTGITSALQTRVKTVNSCYSYDKTTGEAVLHNSSMVNGIHNSNLSTLDVSAKDAMRFSTVTYSKMATATGTVTVPNTPKIYELNEGLGSYATNLNETQYKVNTPAAFAAAYDASKNASYTYSNNINDGLQNALDYSSEVPATYKSLNTKDAVEILTLTNNNDYSDKATFNIWLEGYDADCIDAIVGSTVDCAFSFTSSDTISDVKVTTDMNDGSGNTKEYTLSINPASSGHVGAYYKMDYPAIPLREGYTFEGWYTDENCTEDREFDFTKSVSTSQTIYAKWSEATYSIKFDALGGEGTLPIVSSYTNSQLVDGDKPLTFTLPTLTKVGYTFRGWLENKSTTPIAGGTVISATNIGTLENKTYVAVWEENTYTITYLILGGATGAEGNKTSYTVNDEFTLANPVLDGYIFMGWKVNDSNTLYSNYIVSKGSYGDLTLTAVFAAEDYTIKFDGNSDSATGKMVDVTAKYIYATTLPNSSFVLTGHTFLGWATASDATSVEYNVGDNVNLIASNAEKTVVLYAVWQANDYTIRFDKNHDDATGEMDDFTEKYGSKKAITTCSFERTGYNFLGWATTSNAIEAEYEDAVAFNKITLNEANPNILYAVWQLQS